MRPPVTTILLAAGRSLRMGAQNKLLLSINGIPMIRHMVLRYSVATGGAVLVVTGHEACAVKEALAGTLAQIVFNPDHLSGQQSSVICGLQAAEEADLLLIGLGDQPLLGVSDLLELLSAHHQSDQNKISVPVRGTERGNPIVVPASLRANLLGDPKGPGCRKFTRTHLDRVQLLQMSSDGFFTDVDTPEAYAALSQLRPEVQP